MTMGRRAGVCWLVAAGLLLALLWSFQGVWLRPMVQRALSADPQRAIDFDALTLGLSTEGQPQVSLRGVRIANAAWADSPKPFVRAGELRLTFAWRSLIDHDPIIVSRLTLKDAQVDLERQADGHRNWRLRNPGDVGPGKLRVLSLDAERSEIRFVDAGIALDVRAAIGALPATGARASPVSAAGRLSRLVEFDGTRNGAAFGGRVEVGEVLTLFDTGVPFGLRGSLQAGASSLTVDGNAADIATLRHLDADIRLTGANLAELGTLVNRRFPVTPHYNVRGRLLSRPDEASISALQATVGALPFNGHLRYVRADARASPPRVRPFVQGELHSEAIDLAQLQALITPGAGADPGTSHAARTAPPATVAPAFAALAASAASVTSTGRIDVGPLTRWDADLRVTVGRIALPRLGPLDAVALTLALKNGVLDLSPLGFSWADGRVTGSAHVDTGRAGGSVGGSSSGSGSSSTTPSRLALRLDLSDLQLARLTENLPAVQRMVGRLSGQAVVDAQGDSWSALIRSNTGDARLWLRKASIADRLDAKLALSAGAMLRSLVTGDEQVPLDCATLALGLHDGIATVRRLGWTSARMSLRGSGALDLREPSINLLLTPQMKQSALLTLHRSIRVQGPLTHAAVTLVDPVEIAASQGCEPPATAQVQGLK